MTELKYRGVDMCAPETHDEPWEMYDYLRENDPVYWDEHNEVWYAFRYDDIVDIARDPDRDPDPGHASGFVHQQCRVAVPAAPRLLRKPRRADGGTLQVKTRS